MQVWHMNGAGNDFMVMDARNGNYDFEKLALELCKLTGADGFMAIDRSEKAEFTLHFYNPDCSRARCAATVPGASAGLPVNSESRATK